MFSMIQRFRPPAPSVYRSSHAGRCLLLLTGLLTVVSCRTAVRRSHTEEPDTPETAATGAPLPSPGKPVPIDPKTLARTDTPAWPSEEGEEPRAESQRAIFGEIEAMGPFTAADAADGKWIRISSMSGIPYVLVPSRLWVRSEPLNINKGDGIRVRGYVRTARGRTYLHAVAISVSE